MKNLLGILLLLFILAFFQIPVFAGCPSECYAWPRPDNVDCSKCEPAWGLVEPHGTQMGQTAPIPQSGEEPMNPIYSSPPNVQTGNIQITSSPTGAMVTLDRGQSGLSPFTFSYVPVGFHEITVSMAGYQTYFTSVNVIGGQTTSIDSVLVPIVTTTSPTFAPSAKVTTIPPTKSLVDTNTGQNSVSPLPTTLIDTTKNEGAEKGIESQAQNSLTMSPMIALIACCILIYIIGGIKKY